MSLRDIDFNEALSKDNEVTLDYQGLNYELIPQRNGNFNTEKVVKLKCSNDVVELNSFHI